MEKNTIYVTRPSLPDLVEFMPYLQQIWNCRILTNNGPFHQQFEQELTKFLGVEYVSLFANGTLALMAALYALKISGEVITTPYTFVATPHALYWNNIRPVFCDIKLADGNIDESKIEALITPKTAAIFPVHVYGNPCNTARIQEIAAAHGLKVIYDAAHAFNIKENGASILNAGDLSVLSFHATKTFNTFEGGATICHDKKMKEEIDYIKNFGFKDELTVIRAGINAKLNEFQAALGLLQLKKVKGYIEKNKVIYQAYQRAFQNVVGIRLFEKRPSVDYNYSCCPLLIGPDFPLTRDQVYEKLKQHGIYARRYFYPLVSDFPPYNTDTDNGRNNLPVARAVASRVLCLPIFPDLPLATVHTITQLICE